jgi:hypothetical protein
MKGVIFNLAERIVVAEHGEDAWDDLLDDAGLSGAYTSLGSYDDSDLTALAAAAATKLGLTSDEVVRWLGCSAIPLFAEAYPHFFTPHESARTFVLTLNDIIHPEVRKLYPGAGVPVFEFQQAGHDAPLAMGYRSPRRLCSFAEGLIEGAGNHYGEQLGISQSRCMKRGDDHCSIEIAFDRVAVA